MINLSEYLSLAQSATVPKAGPIANYPLGSSRTVIGTGATIMGVINLSPQSRYRESIALNTEDAINRGRRLVLEGADLVDVGSESTTPGSPTVEADSQLAALLPVVTGLVAHDVPVSVETYNPVVAEACLAEGAVVLNITATPNAEALYRIAAEHQATAIVCYSATGSPRDQGRINPDGDVLADRRAFFETEIARSASVGLSQLVIDPGAGFSYQDLPDGPVRVKHQLEVMMASSRLLDLGHPICNALPHAFTYFAEELRSGEGFFAVLAAIGGTSLFRTHEVRQISALISCLE